MQRRDGQLVLSATDLTKHVACAQLTTLDLQVAEGTLDRPAEGADARLDLIFSKGRQHEQAYLEQLRAQGLGIIEIAEGLDRVRAEQTTVQAMRDGADVIYQATLFDGRWVGRADFLLRRDDRPSGLGSWSYDIADTKLARKLKVPALLQMAMYAERLTTLQGVAPEELVVVTGDQEPHPWRLIDVQSYARRVRDRLLEAVEDRPRTAPVPVPYCAQCRWQPRCAAEWEAADDLSLVAGMRTDQREKLHSAGITTMTQLARAAPEELAGALTRTTRARLHQQARLQVTEGETGRAAYRLLAPEQGRGLQLLPEPDPGDVYLDFEGDPFADGGVGREYLAGVWDRTGEFTHWWAHDQDAERHMVADLLEWLVARWDRYPGMHVYHYAAYEPSALKRLTGRYATAESELDALLRGERFVDLYAVVRQGLQISKGSYSIKKVEDFYWGHTRTAGADEVADALSSVVEYERWLAEGDQRILDSIRDYNQVDVESTLALHDWLEERRAELAAGADVPLVRPEHKEAAEAEDSERIQAENALADRLLDRGGGAATLLAGCVGWHRREDKQDWWDYFRTPLMSEEELLEDRATIGGPGQPVQVGTIKRSTVWRYAFTPQDCRAVVGRPLDDVDTHESAGEVVAVDLDEGWIDLKRGSTRDPLAPRGLGPDGPINSVPLRDSIARTAERVLAGEPTLGHALLRREVPTGMEPLAGEEPKDVVVRVGSSLDGQVLAVQGPPGSGKTFAGSALIRALLDRGLRVGVTAQSHSVITHLLEKVGCPALRKCGKDELDPDAPDDGLIRLADSNGKVAGALAEGSATLVGGTAWLWASEDMTDLVDVLVIDEAGQFSLANAVAVSQAARSLVLLGDPQQLTQPSNATHPYGAGVSALDHLLDGQVTIRSDHGVFLDATWRMHPDITAFVSETSYEGRLGSVDGLDRQRIEAPGSLSGSGVRWVASPHTGYSSENPVEADQVAGLVTDLLGGTWTDREGVSRPMRVEDVLVVAPFNAHVSRLKQVLPEGIPVGTVDKFQGREAPVVLYTMASSSAADAPRGVDFLYDLHRLNVAVSRAKALAAIVGSPALLEAEVRSPEQLRAVNALCRYVEVADPHS